MEFLARIVVAITARLRFGAVVLPPGCVSSCTSLSFRIAPVIHAGDGGRSAERSYVHSLTTAGGRGIG